MSENQFMIEQGPLVEVTLAQINAVFGGAKELYHFLTVECEYYLPPYQYVNVRWMGAIWNDSRKVRILLRMNSYF